MTSYGAGSLVAHWRQFGMREFRRRNCSHRVVRDVCSSRVPLPIQFANFERWTPRHALRRFEEHGQTFHHTLFSSTACLIFLVMLGSTSSSPSGRAIVLPIATLAGGIRRTDPWICQVGSRSATYERLVASTWLNLPGSLIRPLGATRFDFLYVFEANE